MRTIGSSECNTFDEVRELFQRAFQEIDEINFVIAPEKAKREKQMLQDAARLEKKAKADAAKKTTADAKAKKLADAKLVVEKAEATETAAKKAKEERKTTLECAKQVIADSKKGKSVKTLLLLMFVLLFAGTSVAYVPSDINDEIAANHVLLAQYLRDSFANITSNSFLFTPTATVPTAVQGLVYFNSDTSTLQVSLDGSGFSPIDTAGGVSLDSAYDFGSAGGGRTILATDGAVQITNTDNDSTSLLGLTYSGNSTGDGLTITLSTGSGDGIEFENTGSGSDIEGTGATWSVSKVGTFVGVIGTWTGDQTWTGSNANVIFDADGDELLIEDDAILSFGDAADVTVVWDQSNLVIEALTQDAGTVTVGATDSLDWLFYDNGASGIATFNSGNSTLELNGYDLQLLDDDIMAFGDSDEFTVEYNEDGDDQLLIVAGTANDVVQFGDGTSSSTDVKMMASTNDDFVHFDSSADELFFEDADLKINEGAQIEFSVADNSVDWTIDVSTDETLLFLPTEITDDQTFNIGNATNTSDVRIFGATASTVVYDADADEVLFDAYDIAFGESDGLLFGDTLGTGDFRIDSTSAVLLIDVIAAGTGEINIGNDDDDVPLKWFGETSGAFTYLVGDALQFDKMDIAFSESDGLLFGDTLGTGAFRMDSTSAVLSIDVVSAGTGEINIGNDADDVPMKWFGETTLAFAYFVGDALQFDKMDIAFSESDGLLFGDTLGTGAFRIDSTSAVLLIDVVSAGTGEINVGNDDDDVPLKWFAETGSDWVYFNVDEVEFEDVVLQLMDDTPIQLGDGDDATVEYDTTTFNAVLWAGAGHIGDLKIIETEAGTTETVLATESGKVFTTTDSIGTTTYTLPTAAAGLWYTFIDKSITAGDDLKITAGTGDTINGGSVAESYQNESDSVPASVTLVAVDAGSWEVMAEAGTWTNKT